MTAPMTAAEYRRSTGFLTERGNRVLAALEEREALLGERAGVESERAHWHQLSGERFDKIVTLTTELETLKSDASVGALVRRIREHPMCALNYVQIRERPSDHGFTSALTEKALADTLSHLDSLLPKEPEPVVGPSGRQYRMVADKMESRNPNLANEWFPVTHLPLADAPVVAALLGGRNG